MPHTNQDLDAEWREKRDAIAKDYLEGMSLKDMAKKHGYANIASLNTMLYRMRNQYGYTLPFRNPFRGVTP